MNPTPISPELNPGDGGELRADTDALGADVGHHDKPPSHRLVLGVEPTYQSDPLPRGEAASKLKSTISAWFDRVQSQALARNELARRYRLRRQRLGYGARRKTSRKVAKKMRDEVKAKYGVTNLRAGARFAIQAGAGLGKTEVVLQEIVSRRELWSLRIGIFVPTLVLAEKLAERFGKLSGDPAHAPGPVVRVIRGRGAPANEDRRPNEPKTMCRKPDAARLAGELDINIFEALCEAGSRRCEFLETCPWIKQWGDHGPGVLIMVHEYLVLPKRLPPPDMVIIDESVVRVMTESVSFSPDRLLEKYPWAI